MCNYRKRENGEFSYIEETGHAEIWHNKGAINAHCFCTSGIQLKGRRHGVVLDIALVYKCLSRSQWPGGLRRTSAANRLLRLWIRIPPGAWVFVCCECCVLSGRGLCNELITCPEESHRLWFVVCVI
jgi:hypothetical protein